MYYISLFIALQEFITPLNKIILVKENFKINKIKNDYDQDILKRIMTIIMGWIDYMIN